MSEEGKVELRATDFSSYGDEFQKSLLLVLINDSRYLLQLRNVIDADYFDNKYFKDICKLVLEYCAEHNSAPGFDILKILVEKKGINNALLLRKIDEIKSADTERLSFVIDEARDFFLTSYSLKKLEKSLQLLLIGKREESKKYSFEAYKYEDLDDTRVIDVKNDYISLSSESNPYPVPTIYEEFNQISKGGPGAGRLFIQIAPSHFGKTSSLIAQARHAATLGIDTLYISLEDNEKAITLRVISGLLDIEQEELLSHNYDAMINERKKELLKGELIVKHYRSKNGQIVNFKNFYNSLKAQGIFPKLVCIDSLNQAKGEKGMRFRDDNEKFEFLCEEFRDWAEEEQMCVALNFQSNRSGFYNLVADERNTGKAIEVFQVADYVIMYVQDKQMQKVDEAYALLLKNRLGRSRKALKVGIDNGKSVFKVKGRLMDLADIETLAQTTSQIASIEDIRKGFKRN